MKSKESWNKLFRYILVGSLTLFALMIPLSVFMLTVSAVILLIAIILKKITDKNFIIVVPPFTWAILLLLISAIASLIFSPYPTTFETWLGLKKLRYFGYYFLFFFGLYESKEIRLPIVGFLVGCILSSILAWLQYFVGNVSFVTIFNPEIMSSPYLVEKVRAIGFMSHHRRFAMIIAMGIITVASLFIHLRQNWKFKALYIFLLLLFGGSILWTHGRGVILAIIFSTVVVFLLRSWRLAATSILGILIGGLILAYTIPRDVYWLSPKFFAISTGVFNKTIGEQLKHSDVKSGNDIRVILWKTGIKAFLKHPITGIGWGQFRHERKKIDTVITGTDKFPHKHPHSELLWIAVELGMFGFIIFAFFWGSYLLRLIKAYKHREGLTQIVKALLFVGIWTALFWLTAGLTDVALLNPENAAAFWFIVALSSYALYMKKRPTEVKI